MIIDYTITPRGIIIYLEPPLTTCEMTLNGELVLGNKETVMVVENKINDIAPNLHCIAP